MGWRWALRTTQVPRMALCPAYGRKAEDAELRRSTRKMKWKQLSCVWLFETPWTVALQAPLSMEFSSQKYWSGLPFPSPGDLPDPRIEPGSPALHTDSLSLSHLGSPEILYTSWICTSSLCKGHANLLCIVPILVYLLLKRAQWGEYNDHPFI